MRLLYREANHILLIWTCKAAGPIPKAVLEESTQERTGEILTISNTPVEAVPKDLMLYPSLGWTQDVTHLMNWFLYNEGKDLSAKRQAQIILLALAYMSQHMEEWLFK